MNLLEKFYTVIIFLSVLLGLGAGQVQLIQTTAEEFILPLLVAMLYITFLQIPLEELWKAFKYIKFTATSVLINFVWTPLLAWLLAMLFLGGHPELTIGFIMLMVTPCTDWYLIFTGISKGNLALSTAILPLNFLLQIILLPVYLLIIGGETGVIALGFLLESIVIVLGIPLFLAVMTKILLRNKQQLKDSIVTTLSVFPIIFLSLAIVAMFASQGQLLMENLHLLWQITIPVLLFFIINFFVGQKVGRILNFPTRDRVSLSLTTLARNSPIALAIAMTAFPDQPLIALTLVSGPLLELPILAIISQILLLFYKK